MFFLDFRCRCEQSLQRDSSCSRLAAGDDRFLQRPARKGEHHRTALVIGSSFPHTSPKASVEYRDDAVQEKSFHLESSVRPTEKRPYLDSKLHYIPLPVCKFYQILILQSLQGYSNS